MKYTISPRQVTGGVVACVSTTGPRRADQCYGPGSIPQTGINAAGQDRYSRLGSVLQTGTSTADQNQYYRPGSILQTGFCARCFHVPFRTATRPALCQG